MSEDLVGVVVGGAIGVVAALLGTVVTLWLTRAEDRRKADRARRSCLTVCRYETATVASTLATIGPSKVPELVATELAINSGYLVEVSQETARQLLLFRTLVHDLNGTLTTMENVAFAAIGAGSGGSDNPAVKAYYDRAHKTASAVVEQAQVLVRMLLTETGDEGPGVG